MTATLVNEKILLIFSQSLFALWQEHGDRIWTKAKFLRNLLMDLFPEERRLIHALYLSIKSTLAARILFLMQAEGNLPPAQLVNLERIMPDLFGLDQGLTQQVILLWEDLFCSVYNFDSASHLSLFQFGETLSSALWPGLVTGESLANEQRQEQRSAAQADRRSKMLDGPRPAELTADRPVPGVNLQDHDLAQRLGYMLPYFYKQARYDDYYKTAEALSRLNQADGYYARGLSFLHGLGVKADAVEAFKSFLQAAERNLPQAQFVTGVCYELGYGCVSDYAKAFSFYEQAALAGHQEAILLLQEWQTGLAGK